MKLRETLLARTSLRREAAFTCSVFVIATALAGCKSNASNQDTTDTAVADSAEAADSTPPAATADAPSPEGVDNGNENAEKAAEEESKTGNVPEPPAPREEAPGAPPEPGFQHYAGFWQWDLAQRRYLWINGYWHNPNETVTEAPPALRREVVGVSPGPGYTWAGGFWRWGPSRSYLWVPGHYTWWYRQTGAYEHPRWEYAEGRWHYRDTFYARREAVRVRYAVDRRTYAREYARERVTWRNTHAYVKARAEVREHETVRVREHAEVRGRAGTVHTEPHPAEAHPAHRGEEHHDPKKR